MGGVLTRGADHTPSVPCVVTKPTEIIFKSVIRNRSINDDYTFSKTILGRGFSGPVSLVTYKNTNRQYACKCYNKHGASEERLEYLKSEAEVYLRLDHPNIAKLISIYEDDKQLSLIMEHCSGKELYHHLEQKLAYTEQDAAYITFQMLEAIYYLHAHNIVHRDIKLENWLYEDPRDIARLKLIDFGFSKFWYPRKSQKMHASCGSLTYISPETLSGSYTNACDLWSLGVTVYMLLVGRPPFYGITTAEIVRRIHLGQFDIKNSRWKRISILAQDFIEKLLNRDTAHRMTAKEALEHPWIQQRVKLPEILIDIDVLKKMRRFAMSTRFRRVALTMIASCLSSNEIQELVDQFLEFDKNGDGSIQMSDFAEVMTHNFDISHKEIKKLFESIHRNPPPSSNEMTMDEFSIQYTEFVASLLEVRLQLHEDVIRQAFLQFDRDHTGFITIENLKEILGDSFQGETVETLVAVADTNGDGKIDYGEFLEMILTEADEIGSITRVGSTEILGNLVQSQEGSLSSETVLGGFSILMEGQLRRNGSDLVAPFSSFE
ncbi:calcium-dependent protein kinase CDPK4A [Cardiosporidium cionae]|uniref:Calcium-dependent protein kinase CDPK4A n=1 Tax=Cardiosporidium cionae TaxID=476202 RepID=A0ABQ7J7D5_9APIC|nr:calcium-dependent protein kinase CDPK4A [Cardiosporidium cionae]|eukprot:KAF8819886.1 calcium-dependent protein kinase CDPK4A [Cardiosporidium cionae]